MRDYSERRQSRTAPPAKRPPVWPYVLLILGLILLAFAAGFGTGWYLYRPGGRLYKAPPQPQPAVAPKAQPALPPQGQPITPAPVQNPAQKDPAADKAAGAAPLTFYKTLPQGNKELMGTGINQPKATSQDSSHSKPATLPAER